MGVAKPHQHRLREWFQQHQLQFNMVNIILLFLFALLLRLYRLDAQSLWLDEGGTWAEVTGRTGKGWLRLLSELGSADASYPLYHLLLKAWVSIAGDSEWALRFPSALASALAVICISMAAGEIQAAQDQSKPKPAWFSGILAAIVPFALWHAQDAKAYSLLFLAVSGLAWACMAALRQNSRRSWLTVLIVAGISLCVHRLALTAVAAVAIGCAIQGPWRREWRIGCGLLGIAAATTGIAGTLRAAAAERALGGQSGVGPLAGLGLSIARFSLDRWPGDLDGYLQLPLLIWLLPNLFLAILGLIWAFSAAKKGNQAATIALCLFMIPLGLLAILQFFAPVYEARYTMVAFPGWLLILGASYRNRSPNQAQSAKYSLETFATHISVGLLFFTYLAILLQPHKGLWSGDPLKEQWREAIQTVANKVHPDDLLLIYPSYVAVMYDYYSTRVSRDTLPAALTFPVFAEGDTCGQTSPAEIRKCWQRRYEPFFNTAAQGKKRALLLIAPDHARTVDPPKTIAELLAETATGQPAPTSGDRYGWVGLRFQYPQKTWPCGGTGNALIGVEVMCQSFPETYQAGAPGSVPQPTIRITATFGGELGLRGYSVSPFQGIFQAGGTIPITLYWAAQKAPSEDYHMFLHLCQACETPPVANDDGPPLSGYPPAGLTSTWRVGDPLHDERSMLLPANLPAGRYTILLGVYGSSGRLAINGGQQLSNNRLILGEIEISR